MELTVQVPCLLRCKTHAVGGIWLFSVTCTVRERPHTVLIGVNCAFVPFFCVIVITFLRESCQYRRIVEPLNIAIAILLKFAITALSNAGISVPLEAVEKIKYCFFAFGVVYFFSGYSMRRRLNQLQQSSKRIGFCNFFTNGYNDSFQKSIFGCFSFRQFHISADSRNDSLAVLNLCVLQILVSLAVIFFTQIKHKLLIASLI